MAASKYEKVKKMLPLIGILSVAILGFIFFREYLSFETLRDNRTILIEWRNGNYFFASVVFIVAYIIVAAFSLPGAAIFSLSGGFLFGVFPGSLYNIVAATIGATFIFWAARAGMGDMVARKLENSGGAVAKINEGLKRNEVSFLLIMRLMPVFPFVVANLVPAMFGTKTIRFIWTTFVGIIPGGVVYTWVGSGLGAVFARGETPNMGIIFEWEILGPILAMAALSLLPVLFRKKETV